MTEIETLEHFINEHLISAQGNFAPAEYEFSATIYRARLKGSFLSTLLNGVDEEISFSAQPGKNRYHEMLRWLRQLSGYEDCFWFYILDSSDGKSTLSWVKKARFASKNGDGDNDGDLFLSHFQTQPALQGGGAYLGLIGESGKWLLLHTHYPEQEFEMAIYGPTKLCNDLCKLVRTTG